MKRHVPDGLLVAFRNDLKRNNCAMLRYAIFSSERSAGDGPDGSKQQQVGNAKRTDGAATANGRLGGLVDDETSARQGGAQGDGVDSHVSYEHILVKRGPVVDHPVTSGRKVRLVQVMSLRGDTLASALETLKYLRKVRFQ